MDWEGFSISLAEDRDIESLKWGIKLAGFFPVDAIWYRPTDWRIIDLAFTQWLPSHPSGIQSQFTKIFYCCIPRKSKCTVCLHANEENEITDEFPPIESSPFTGWTGPRGWSKLDDRLIAQPRQAFLRLLLSFLSTWSSVRRLSTICFVLTTDTTVPSTTVRDESTGNARSYRSPPVSKDREKALKERAYTEKIELLLYIWEWSVL